MMETGKPKIEVVALKLPLSVRCNTCSNVMNKNTELNVQEESSREVRTWFAIEEVCWYCDIYWTRFHAIQWCKLVIISWWNRLDALLFSKLGYLLLLLSLIWASGTPKLLLMFDCTKCSARIAMKTDEERRTFCVASGATRAFRTRNGMNEVRT